MYLILVVLLVLLVLGGVPNAPWPVYQHPYGYALPGGLGLVLLILLVLVLAGRL